MKAPLKISIISGSTMLWFLAFNPIAKAEPYSGSPKDDPAVILCSWLVLLFGSIVVGCFASAIHSSGSFVIRKFVLLAIPYAVVFGFAIFISGAFSIVIEIVSLILHLLF